MVWPPDMQKQGHVRGEQLRAEIILAGGKSARTFALDENAEGTPHQAGMGELVDRVARGAELTGGARDDFLDDRRADFEEVMGLVGETNGFETELLAEFNQRGELNVGGDVLLAD